MKQSPSTPEGYLLPVEDAAKLGDPEDAIECCIARLSGSIEVFADSTDGADSTPQEHLNGFSWSLRNQVATLKYLRQVKRRFLELQQGE